ncbi:MAG: polyphosphate:AMP phosphotransferase [Planctomycetes bacterium]|nr:polyphosphate:AMP phosphotransferase [Planctomycetota bacterium]
MSEAVSATKMTRAEYEQRVPALRTALLRAQDELAERDFPVVVTLDGPDLIGGDDVFEVLHEWFDARFLRSDAFGPPSDAEKRFPFLWRYWNVIPPRGTILLLRRSWTASAIVRRTFGELNDAELDLRIEHLQELERQLVAAGALLVKFWLHVDQAVLQSRIEKARKRNRYAFRDEEWAIAKCYDEGREVARRVLAATDQGWAPWHVLRGEDRRWRNLEVGTILARALQARLAQTQPTQPGFRTVSRAPSAPRLAQVDPRAPELECADYDRQRDELQERFTQLTRKAEHRGLGAVLVIEGWDAAGKGGAIRRVTHAMDAQMYKIFPIRAPDEREKSRPYMWRFWRRLPPMGRVSIFDRSWYGRVLVERVEGFAAEPEWRAAYAEIEDFERQLVEHGYAVYKAFLHVSEEEQLRRFEERRDTPYKRHKLTDEDWRNRDKRGPYEAAIDEMLARTSGAVPWHVVPADDKRTARLAVLRGVVDVLERALARQRES